MQIIVDTASLTSQFDISKDQIDALVDSVTKSVAASYAERLSRIAGEGLRVTKVRYQNAIKVLDSGRFTGTILLSYADKLVQMLEEGASAFDMKEGFSRSDKKHTKANGQGWYLSIPLAQGTPDTLGESSPFANVMPQEVYQEVKQKPADIPTPTGLKSKGLTLEELPEKYQLPETRAAVTSIITNKKFDEYVSKTSIYAGIMKIQDTVTGQNRYMSFRRVSDKSDSNSWIFTGLDARKFTDKAMDELESNLEQELHLATENALNQLGIS